MNAEAKKKVLIVSIFFCVLLTVVFDVFPPAFFSSERKNFYFGKSLSLAFGTVGIFLLMKREKSGLFGKPTKILWFLLAIIVALDNFQWASFLSGKMQLDFPDVWDWILFASYCLLTGLFEEGIFRGVLFPLIVDRCEKSKKGLIQAVVYSSLLFGGVHLLNVFSGGGLGAVVLQALYSVLTGGLFAFILIKTKNIFFCAFAHGAYNFCGMLFSQTGLGTGVVFDLPTAITMLIVSSVVAIIVFWGIYKYTDKELQELYTRLGISLETKAEENSYNEDQSI